MSNESLWLIWLATVLVALFWMGMSDDKEKRKEQQKLKALKAKSAAHKLLVPIFMEQRHELGKSLADSLQGMKSTAAALGFNANYREVSKDVLEHEKVID